MKHEFITNDYGKIVAERFENENVIITTYLSGEFEIEFKPNCDKKVKQLYKKLIKE